MKKRGRKRFDFTSQSSVTNRRTVSLPLQLQYEIRHIAREVLVLHTSRQVGLLGVDWPSDSSRVRSHIARRGQVPSPRCSHDGERSSRTRRINCLPPLRQSAMLQPVAFISWHPSVECCRPGKQRPESQSAVRRTTARDRYALLATTYSASADRRQVRHPLFTNLQHHTESEI